MQTNLIFCSWKFLGQWKMRMKDAKGFSVNLKSIYLFNLPLHENCICVRNLFDRKLHKSNRAIAANYIAHDLSAVLTVTRELKKRVPHGPHLHPKIKSIKFLLHPEPQQINHRPMVVGMMPEHISSNLLINNQSPIAEENWTGVKHSGQIRVLVFTRKRFPEVWLYQKEP